MKITRTKNFNQWVSGLAQDEKLRVGRKIELVERVPYGPGQNPTFSRDVRHITETELSAIPTGDVSRGGNGYWVVFSLREDEAIFLGGLDNLHNRHAIERIQQSLDEYKTANPHDASADEKGLVSAGGGSRNPAGAALLARWSGGNDGRGGGSRR